MSLLSALGSERQEDLFEFKASLGYKVSSKTTKTVIQRNPILKKQKK